MNLLNELPEFYKEEEETVKFIEIFEDIATIIESDIEKWTDILDPDTAEEKYLDEMLYEINWTLPFLDEPVTTKKKIVKIGLLIYQYKGVTDGIRFVIQYLLGIPVDKIIIYEPYEYYWQINSNYGLGRNTRLGSKCNPNNIYWNKVEIYEDISSSVEEFVRSVIDYMKCSHTRYTLEIIIP